MYMHVCTVTRAYTRHSFAVQRGRERVHLLPELASLLSSSSSFQSLKSKKLLCHFIYTIDPLL